MIDYSKYTQSYLARGIWEKWHSKTWEDYVSPEGHDIVTPVRDLVETETKATVLLYGKNGTGKTMLMNIAMKELLHRGKSVVVLDFRDLVSLYTASIWRHEGRLLELLDYDYVGIDDLGKEFSSSDMSRELVCTVIDYVIRYRNARQKSTWITFNLLLKEVAMTYNEHIASLFKRDAVAIGFDGVDFGDNQLNIIKTKK